MARICIDILEAVTAAAVECLYQDTSFATVGSASAQTLGCDDQPPSLRLVGAHSVAEFAGHHYGEYSEQRPWFC